MKNSSSQVPTESRCLCSAPILQRRLSTWHKQRSCKFDRINEQSKPWINSKGDDSQPRIICFYLRSINSCSWRPPISKSKNPEKTNQCHKDDPRKIALWAAARFCSKRKPPRTSIDTNWYYTKHLQTVQKQHFPYTLCWNYWNKRNITCSNIYRLFKLPKLHIDNPGACWSNSTINAIISCKWKTQLEHVVYVKERFIPQQFRTCFPHQIMIVSCLQGLSSFFLPLSSPQENQEESGKRGYAERMETNKVPFAQKTPRLRLACQQTKNPCKTPHVLLLITAKTSQRSKFWKKAEKNVAESSKRCPFTICITKQEMPRFSNISKPKTLLPGFWPHHCKRLVFSVLFNLLGHHNLQRFHCISRKSRARTKKSAQPHFLLLMTPQNESNIESKMQLLSRCKWSQLCNPAEVRIPNSR